MICLSIETCFKEASISLFKNNTIVTKEIVKPNSQSDSLMKMTQDILNENLISVKDLSCVLSNKGPGSFTGLRVGLSFVEGLCFGSNIKKLYLSSFASLLGNLPNIKFQKDILVVIHAIRGTFYVQKFSPKLIELSSPKYFTLDQLNNLIAKENCSIFGSFEGYTFDSDVVENKFKLNSKSVMNAFLNFPHLAQKDSTPLYLRSAVNN